jgi:hypothetical protein
MKSEVSRRLAMGPLPTQSPAMRKSSIARAWITRPIELLGTTGPLASLISPITLR